jgi:hypothetical protein
MAVGDGVGGIADVAGLAAAVGAAPTEQARALQDGGWWAAIRRREVGVALPGVGAGLEAGRVFEIEAGRIGAGLVFQVVGEEFGFDLGANSLPMGSV